MRCPSCGHKEAYMGFSSIDCPNPSCRHHSSSASPAPTTTSAPISTPAAPTTTPTSHHIGTTAPSPLGAPSSSSGATGVATLNLRADIKSTTIKLQSVLLEVVAHGDPGVPNKNIEITWSLPNMTTPRICTLSTRHIYLMTGIDADGTTVYTTHWQCTRDGINPSDPWTLDARVF